MKLVNDVLFRDPSVQDDFVEEFNELDVTSRWTDTSADSGAACSLSTDGTSQVLLTTGGTNNNECTLSSKRTWDLAAGQPLTMDFQANYAEANTDDSNNFGGLSSVTAADFLIDDGGGPVASFSGMGFYKVDGGTTWNFITSVGSSRTVTALTETAGGTAMQNFRIEVRPISSTQVEVIPLIGQQGNPSNYFAQCIDANGNLVRHVLTYTSVAAMYAVFANKAGGANSEVFKIDRVRVSQVKA